MINYPAHVVYQHIIGASAADIVANLGAVLVSAGWTSQGVISGFNVYSSAKTTQGLICLAGLKDDGAGACIVTVGASTSSYVAMFLTAGTDYEVRATDFDFYAWVLNDVTTPAKVVMGGVPVLRDISAPGIIASIADDGTGQIEITLSAAQTTWATNDFVFINASLGLVFDGTYQITRISDTVFILNGSAYSPGYTADSGIIAKLNSGQISRCVWALSNGAGPTFRNAMAVTTGLIVPSSVFADREWMWYLAVNDTEYGSFFGGVPIQIFMPRAGDDPGYPLHPIAGHGSPRANWGNAFDISEARLVAPIGVFSGPWFVIGELWAAFAFGDGVVADTVVTAANGGPDGRDWICFTDNQATGGLWLAKT